MQNFYISLTWSSAQTSQLSHCIFRLPDIWKHLHCKFPSHKTSTFHDQQSSPTINVHKTARPNIQTPTITITAPLYCSIWQPRPLRRAADKIIKHNNSIQKPKQTKQNKCEQQNRQTKTSIGGQATAQSFRTTSQDERDINPNHEEISPPPILHSHTPSQTVTIKKDHQSIQNTFMTISWSKCMEILPKELPPGFQQPTHFEIIHTHSICHVLLYYFFCPKTVLFVPLPSNCDISSPCILQNPP